MLDRPVIVRRALSLLVLTAIPLSAFGETPRLGNNLVRATFKLSNPEASATGFILSRPDPNNAQQTQFILVTAAHVLERREVAKTTIVFRTQNAEGEYTKLPVEVEIRKAGKPLWTQHPEIDVAAILVALPDEVDVPHLPLDLLATEEDLRKHNVGPGETVRCVGFPHAAQFEPNEAGFPLVRLGCIASYPLLPIEKNPIFLMDFNTFEGDSGGPVYLSRPNHSNAGESVEKILGLVNGRHFLNLEYDLIYYKSRIRKRLGLATVVHAKAIKDTTDRLP